MNLDDALDRLYGVPLEEFTSTRNLLAKELGDEGVEIKKLKKPNVAAWVVNQLVRRRPKDVEELFEVTDRLRMAHRRALSGGKAADLRKATDERNAVVSRLVRLAEEILTEAGHGSSASTLSGVSETFVAVASQPDGADVVRLGRLTRELEPGAFVDVGGLSLVRGGRDEEEAREEEGDAGAVEAARDAVSTARARVKEAKEALKEAVAEQRRLDIAAGEAERKAKAAREEAEFAGRAADGRRADVEAAEQALEEAQKALKNLG